MFSTPGVDGVDGRCVDVDGGGVGVSQITTEHGE